MYKIKKCALLVVSFIGVQYNIYAQAKIEGLEELKAIMGNCSIDYTMKCIYSSGQVYNAVGKMAMKAGKYYDSSNLRFVLQDNEWYIIADHLEREVSVANLKKANEEMEGISSVTGSSYLFGEDFFDRIHKVDVVKQTIDTSWVRVRFKDSSVIEKLVLQRLRKNNQPISYYATVNFPIGGDGEGPASTVKLEIHCFNVVTPAADALFDWRRFISVQGKVVTLKKFNKYKTYK